MNGSRRIHRDLLRTLMLWPSWMEGISICLWYLPLPTRPAPSPIPFHSSPPLLQLIKYSPPQLPSYLPPNRPITPPSPRLHLMIATAPPRCPIPPLSRRRPPRFLRTAVGLLLNTLLPCPPPVPPRSSPSPQLAAALLGRVGDHAPRPPAPRLPPRPGRPAHRRRRRPPREPRPGPAPCG